MNNIDSKVYQVGEKLGKKIWRIIAPLLNGNKMENINSTYNPAREHPNIKLNSKF